MTNYYEELDIDPNASTADINAELSELEAKWIRRETVNPDKARDMLSLISGAKKAFKDDAERQNYDRLLDADKNAPADNNGAGNAQPSGADKAEINRMIQKAESYYHNKEFDLASGIIEEVFDMTRPAERDLSTYVLAADIYSELNQFDTSIKYINKAISKRAAPEFLNEKAQICYKEIQRRGRYNCDEPRTQMTYALEDALKTNTSDKNKSISYGLFAAMYWALGSVTSAQECADKALALGDAWGYGRQIKDFINRKNEIDKYSSLMPTGYVLFFIVEILTIILVPATGGVLGVCMIILSLVGSAFLVYSSWAYPYGGGAMAWSIILSLVMGLVISILFGNNYDMTSAIAVIEFFVLIAVVIVFCVLGHVRRTEINS